MTVAELIEMLEDFNPDAQVLIATQPSWPLQFDVDDAVEDEHFDPDAVDGTVWLRTGGHPHDRSPYAPQYVFGEV